MTPTPTVPYRHGRSQRSSSRLLFNLALFSTLLSNDSRPAATGTQTPGSQHQRPRAAATITILLILFAICSIAQTPAIAQNGPPPANVIIAPVVRETVERWRNVTGELVARRRSVLAAEQAGLIVRLGVEVGDAVEQGQIIASLDTQLKELDIERLRAMVETRQAAVLVRKNQRDFAARDLERIESSAAERSIPPTELDQFRTRLNETEAQLVEAQAELRTAEAAILLAERELEKMHIRAPFTGRVASKRAEVGQWAAVGEPIVEIIDMQSIEARLDVPERYATRLRSAPQNNANAARNNTNQLNPEQNNAAAITRVNNDPTFSIVLQLPAFDEEQVSRIVAIAPQADPLSRLIGVRTTVNNPDETIKPGMRVTGSVPSGELEPHILLPKDAILRDDAGTFVYAAIPGPPASAPTGNNSGPPTPTFQALPMRVEIIFATGSRVAIRSASISPGMFVVIEGNERLFPTQPLNILNREIFEPPRGHTQPPDPESAADAGSNTNNTSSTTTIRSQSARGGA